jgi:WD40 repeat protein
MLRENPMKQFFIITVLIFCIVLKAHTQESYEYPYIPLLSISTDESTIAISGRIISDDTSATGFHAPIDFYDANTGELINSFDGSEDPINGIALNSNGSLLAYSTNYGRLAIVELQSGLEAHVMRVGGVVRVGNPIWSSDDRVVVSSSGYGLDIYDAQQSYYALDSFHTESTTRVAGFDWSKESNTIIYSTHDLDTFLGILVVVQVLPNFEMTSIKTIDAPVAATVAVSNDGSKVAVNTQDGVLVTNIADESQFLLPKTDLENPILSLDWSPDGTKLVVGGGGTVDVWDIQIAEISYSMIAESPIGSLVWSSDGQHLYYASNPAGIYRDGLPLQEAIAADQSE